MDEVEELAKVLLADYLQLKTSEQLTYGESFYRYAGGLDAYSATPMELMRVFAPIRYYPDSCPHTARS